VNMATSDLIALFSLAVALFALWGTEVSRVLDARTALQKGQDTLRLALDQLAQKIPQCLRSRQHVAAANGQRASAQALQAEVETDLPELQRLRARVGGIPWIPMFRGPAIAADAAVTLHEIEGRVNQLTAKYDAAWAEDEAARERIWAGVLARIPPRGGREA